MIDETAIAARYQAVSPLLDERARRLTAGAEALAIGRGGVAAVSRATGLARTTVARGVADVQAGETVERGRIRRPGAGRPPIEQRDPTLRADLEALIEPTTRGDPESPLRWTTRSVRNLADELRRLGHTVSHQTVSELLHEHGLQPPGQPQDARGHQPPRPRRPVPAHQRGRPARALPGRARDQRRHQEEGAGRTVPQRGQGAAPGGRSRAGADARLRDQSGARSGEPLRRLRHRAERGLGERRHRPRHGGLRGREHPPLVADHGRAAVPRRHAAAGHRRRRRQQRLRGSGCGRPELQKLADETGLEIAVCHFPPGTSKWNKIEHRLFPPSP